MITVELDFDPTPERLSARPAHRRLLARHHGEGRLWAAGPWSDDSGALLLFTGDEEDVRDLLRDDPYLSSPGVRLTSIRAWSPFVGPG